MADGDVAVVIPVYNGEQFIAEAVESVLGQTKAPAQIVVVDDGSTDGTLDVLRRYRDSVEIVAQANGGVARARNVGAARTSAPLLAFLDADDAWEPEKLARQVATFEGAPGIGLVHCGVVEVDEHGAPLRTVGPGLSGRIAADIYRLERSAVLGGGSGAVFRADVFRSVGAYDERLSTSADWDLFLRVALASEVAFVADPLVRYRVHGSNMSRNVALMEHDMRIAMGKADDLEELRPHRRRAHANLRYALGGGFVATGEPLRGARLLLEAVALRPAIAPRALAAVARRVAPRRQRGATPASPRP